MTEKYKKNENYKQNDIYEFITSYRIALESNNKDAIHDAFTDIYNFIEKYVYIRHYRIARKTAANLDAQHSCLRIKLSVGCKRRFYFSYICQSFHISVCDIQYVETPHTP